MQFFPLSAAVSLRATREQGREVGLVESAFVCWCVVRFALGLDMHAIECVEKKRGWGIEVFISDAGVVWRRLSPGSVVSEEQLSS